MKIFKKLEHIFNEYMYNPRHESINMNSLFNDLKQLGDLIHTVAPGKKKTSSIKSLPGLASGIKNHKTKRNIRLSIFKRKDLIKRFKNPFLLSLK